VPAGGALEIVIRDRFNCNITSSRAVIVSPALISSFEPQPKAKYCVRSSAAKGGWDDGARGQGLGRSCDRNVRDRGLCRLETGFGVHQGFATVLQLARPGGLVTPWGMPGAMAAAARLAALTKLRRLLRVRNRRRVGSTGANTGLAQVKGEPVCFRATVGSRGICGGMTLHGSFPAAQHDVGKASDFSGVSPVLLAFVTLATIWAGITASDQEEPMFNIVKRRRCAPELGLGT
jgi:hypothetical protein